MSSARIRLIGLVSALAVIAVSCGGQVGHDVAMIQDAIESLRQDVESLSAAVEGLEKRDGGTGQIPGDDTGQEKLISAENADPRHSFRSRTGYEATFSGGMNEVARETAELTARVEALETGATALEEAVESRIPDGDTFTLQLLHTSDMDGSTGALENVENFSAILDGFRSRFPDNTLVVSSGDNYIPGPRYFAAGDDVNTPILGVSGNGRGDIALLNAMGFQSSDIRPRDGFPKLADAFQL